MTENSYFLAFCRYLTNACHESATAALLRRFYAWLTAGLFASVARAYRESRVGGLLRRFFTWTGMLWDQSGVHRLIYRIDPIERSWEDSFLCRGLSWLVNLPLRLLQYLYRVLKGAAEGSVFVRLALWLGEHAYVVAFLLMAVLTSLHQKYYRNSYMLAVAGVILALTYLGRVRRPTEKISFRAVQPWVVLFFLACVLSILAADDFSVSFRYLSYYIPCAMLILAVIHAADTPKHLGWVAGGLVVGVAATALYGFYQFFVIGVKPSSSYTDLTLNAGMPGRIYSLYDNPNALGGFLMLVLPIVAALTFASHRRICRLAAAGAGCLGIVCILMTYSRTSWVSLIVAALLYLLLWERSALPYCLLAAIALVPLLPDVVLNRFATIANPKDTSANSRTALFAAGWKVFRDHPLTGAGLGEDAVRAAVGKCGYFNEKVMRFIHAHNMLLQLGAETGLMGVIPYVAAIIESLKETAQSVRGTDCKLAKHIAIGGASALAGSFVYGIADYLWTYPRVMFLFWFVFGLTLAGIRLCRENVRAVKL